MSENNHPNKITYFAATNFRNQMRKFGIKREDRRRHIYILGKTGSGKTTLMANMALQDIESGEGIAIVDPHGDVINSLLDYIPSNRINDVVYFNPSDTEYPIAFNVLENVNPEHKHLVASGLMSVFYKIWANLWSARMEYILNNTILALLDAPGNTLLGIMRMLADKEYRSKIIEKVKDPIVKSFWVNEFAAYNDRFRQEAIAPIQNKVGQFLSSAIIRNVVGQPKSTIDLRKIIDEGKILVLDLAKGRIGEDNSNLLGAMMITKLWLAAMSRADLPEEKRRDFYLHVDEFQNFATESFADILSEARKYRLSLTVANQYIAQLTSQESTRVKDAVFGNVGTIICFRVGAADARELIREFEPTFTEEDLVNIGKYDVVLKLMIDGMASAPFTAKTLPPLSVGKENKNREKIIKASRERYSHPREEVEDKILRWSGVDEVFKETAKSEKLSGGDSVFKAGTKTEDVSFTKTNKETAQNKEDKIEAFCDNCGVKTYINFIPDLSKSIFCKDCLKEFKKGNIDPRKLSSKNSHLKKWIEQQKNKQAVGESQPVVDGNKQQLKDEKEIKKENNKKTKINLMNNTNQTDDELESGAEDEVSLSNLKNDSGVVSFKTNKASSVKPGQVVRI